MGRQGNGRGNEKDGQADCDEWLGEEVVAGGKSRKKKGVERKTE